MSVSENDLKRLFREVLQETLQREHVESRPPERHWKAEELDDSCPECKQEKEKIARKQYQDLKDQRKKEPYICEDCGIGITKKEMEDPLASCPFCSGRKAKEKEEV